MKKMHNIKELIKKLCPNGVEFVELSNKELFKFYYGKGNKIPEDVGGIYNVYGANGIVSHINEYNCEDITIIGHIGAVGMVNRCKGKCFVTYNGTIAEVVDKSKVNTQYLYYVLTTLNLPSYKKGSQPFLSFSDFKNIKIPVPPIEVQNEIVRILDDFTELEVELEVELEAELEVRKKQYEHYRDEVFRFKNNKNVEYKKLGKIATISRGGNFQKKDFVSNGFPCIHYGQIYTKYGLYANKVTTFISESTAKKSKIAKPNDIIMAVTSENVEDVCKCVAWVGKENIAVSGHTAIIHSELNAKYLSYYFHTNMFYTQKLKYVHGTKVIEFTPKNLENIEIPIVSNEEQEKIVSILDRFDKLCNDISDGLPAELEARRKQYEYYRDKLLNFKELKVENKE